MDWTIGADIEVMLEKNGKLISAVALLPSDQCANELPHGTVFHDNVLAEFTIKPASSHKEFAQYILENVHAIEQALLKDGVKTRITASARYPKSELESDQAKRFGCSPDYDAYALKVNQVTAEAHETDLRSAGGHIHFSHPIFEDPYKVIDMIKLMDLQGIGWVYKQTQTCLELLLKNETVASLGLEEKEVRRIINEADVSAAQHICEKLGLT